MPFAHLSSVVAEVAPVAERFADAGHRLYLVGGIVRDLWFDREPARDLDLDLTTDATPGEIKRLVGPIAEAIWLQGERFGTVGATIADRPYEITTHRNEIYRDDSRKPQVSFSTAIDEDLSRRDFTVNAMAVDARSSMLVDPFGGADDLAGGRLRTPLDPEISFADDPLRMLRAARFATGYDLEPDPGLVSAMTSMRERLDIVSAERIRDELDKLLSVDRVAGGLELLSATGLLERFLPECNADRVAERGALLGSLARDPELRLVALLVGTSRDRVASRLDALRYPNDRQRQSVAMVDAVAGLADGTAVADTPAFRRWVARAGTLRFDARAIVAAIDPSAQPAVDASLALEAELADELDDLGLPIGGQEVIELLGIAPGPEVGEAIDHLQERRFDIGPMTRAEASEELLAWWNARGE